MLHSAGLQLLYRFENTALDGSGNGRDGTVCGSGVYADGQFGRCLYFDGTGDYVITPSFGLSGTVVVFAAWVKCGFHPAVYQTLVGDKAQSSTVGFIFCYWQPNTNRLNWQYADGADIQIAIAETIFAGYDDTWMHLAVVCDYSGKSTYFYRNGVLNATVGMTGTPVSPSTARMKYFGSYSTTQHFLTDGYLDEVQLYTLPTCPSVDVLTANAKRMMMGMAPVG